MKSLINILSETITNKLHEQEEEGTLIDAQVTPPNDEGNHYLDKTPDNGWKEFWLDWNGDDKWQDLSPNVKNNVREMADEEGGVKGLEDYYGDGFKMSLTDEEFLKEYDKSREDFKKDFRQEIVNAKNLVINKYKKYYSPDKKAVYDKVYKQVIAKDGRFGANLQTKEILKGIGDKLENMRTSVNKTLVHYNKSDVANANGESYRAWGWVWPSAGGPQGNDVYNVNLFAFTNPTLGAWRKKLYNTTYHEIGHNLSYLFKEYDIDAYTTIKSQEIFGDDALINKLIKATGGKGWLSWNNSPIIVQEKIAKEFSMSTDQIANLLWAEYYVNRPAEDYARVQRLRDVFGLTGDKTPNAKWWAKKFYKKVQSGSITTGNVKQTRKLRIPKYDFTLNGDYQEKEYIKKGDWQYNCGIQKFLWSQGIFGVGKIENGKEVCDGAYGPNTKAAVKKFYKDMISNSKTRTRTFITIPKSMLRYNDLPTNPSSYRDLWRVFANTIWWDNDKMEDIAALFAKSAWDTLKNTATPNPDEVQVVIDWNWITKEDATFVDASDEIGDDVGYEVA